MNDELPSDEIWPPAPSGEPPIEPAEDKRTPRVLPYLGGFILSVCAELYSRAALDVAAGWCGEVLRAPGILPIVFGAFVWCIVDIVRGALSKARRSILFGLIGLCICLYASKGLIDNLSCVN